MTLDEIKALLDGMPEDKRNELVELATEATKDMPWVPNPGPQTDAYFCEADELFYGGSAGGGKSDLTIGLSLTQHRRSLILRRFTADAESLAERALEVVGSRNGYNGQSHKIRLKDRVIDFGGCKDDADKQRWKGDPHDLIGFDEIGDFLKSQFTFIKGWNRSGDPNQRCRVVCTGNPPTNPEGLWVIEYWAPWLDPKHPNPAKPGELRWFTTVNGVDTEVEHRGPHKLPGEYKFVFARSRTFIPAALEDNPDLAASNYDSVLAGLPAELRAAYRDGNFQASLKDGEFQLIPTHWILQAQARWRPDGGRGLSMTAMGFDPAGGGRDSAELARRHGHWYDELISAQGPETSDGSAAAATIVTHRRDNCPVVIDVGGGYAGATIVRLDDNSIPYAKYNGASATTEKTKEGGLSFVNKRAMAWWRFREELDPDQPGGSVIALPPDPELRADLAAPTFEVKRGGILIESKDDIKKRLGRSPGKGDAVVMAMSEGDKIAAKLRTFSHGATPKVVMSQRYSVKRR